jgi:hypothetical protein
LVAVIAIGVIRVAHEIGAIGARAIVIGAIAARDRFDEAARTVIALPRPGADIAVAEAVIRGASPRDCEK